MSNMDSLNEKNVEREVITVISDRLGIPLDNVKNDSNIYEDLNASKLEFADIIQTLEEKYDLKFDLEEVKSLNTPLLLAEYIENNAD